MRQGPLMGRCLVVIAVAGLALGLYAPAGADSGAARPREAEAMAAEVNRQPILMVALERHCGNSYATLDLQILAAKHGQLRFLINDLLLRQEANRRGIALDRLLEQVKDLDGIPVSAEEIQNFRD